jgi:hypothetical protein
LCRKRRKRRTPKPCRNSAINADVLNSNKRNVIARPPCLSKLPGAPRKKKVLLIGTTAFKNGDRVEVEADNRPGISSHGCTGWIIHVEKTGGGTLSTVRYDECSPGSKGNHEIDIPIGRISVIPTPFEIIPRRLRTRAAVHNVQQPTADIAVAAATKNNEPLWDTLRNSHSRNCGMGWRARDLGVNKKTSPEKFEEKFLSEYVSLKSYLAGLKSLGMTPNTHKLKSRKDNKFRKRATHISGSLFHSVT